jgi:hypothetical protein
MSSRRILATRYHHRRIFTCFGSYHPEGRQEIEEIVARLPDRGAQRELRELGFTTVILRHTEVMGPLRDVYRLQFHRGPDAPRILLSTKTLTAFELGS